MMPALEDRSQWLGLCFENIPAAMRELGWVLWRAEPRGEDKPAKVPYLVADPASRASSTDPATWATFSDACEAYGALMGLPGHPVRGAVVGIGVVLTRAAGITCLDLDRVLDLAGRLDPRAGTIVERCDSWTERSPSNTGLHVFVRGTVPRALKGDQIEVYSEGRYIAVTGRPWPGPARELRPQQGYLDQLVKLAAETGRPRRPWTRPVVPPPDDLAGALLAKLRAWGIPGVGIKPWLDGSLVELDECPWADQHTTGRGGAAVMIHASGAFDFTCLHAHCGARDWREFRAVMDGRA